jgi:hypothetical protein
MLSFGGRDEVAVFVSNHRHVLVITQNFLLLQVNNTMCTYSPTQKVLEPNFLVGAPSSARLPEAGSQLNCVVLPGNLIMGNYNWLLYLDL